MGFGGESYPPAGIGFGAHPEIKKNPQSDDRCGSCYKGGECECNQEDCACKQKNKPKK
ncbi:MAG TPA: hypothetical protein VKO42_03155 [Patescibacteria group bacterium]|nr:hypothetical protein [Patescibacteria group bacterium]